MSICRSQVGFLNKCCFRITYNPCSHFEPAYSHHISCPQQTPRSHSSSQLWYTHGYRWRVFVQWLPWLLWLQWLKGLQKRQGFWPHHWLQCVGSSAGMWALELNPRGFCSSWDPFFVASDNFTAASVMTGEATGSKSKWEGNVRESLGSCPDSTEELSYSPSPLGNVYK